MVARRYWLTGFLALAIVGRGNAQVPPPPPASPTLWSFLGIPQGLYKIHAQVVNRRGNFPGLEKKPPLKAIADVANLKSDVPAIKAAAEIKQAEDLKPQKIKAIKYLATIGCGCYDKDEKITKALLAATEDCTEDVRLEAVRSVELAAQGEACQQCKQKNCCNEKLVAQLSKMAYERDDKGCYVEPSQRVREAATSALRACCPGRAPVTEAAPTPAPVEGVNPPTPRVEGTDPAPGNTTDPPPPPPADRTTNSHDRIPVKDRTASVVPRTHLASTRRTPLTLTDTPAPDPSPSDSESPPVVRRVHAPVTRVSDGRRSVRSHRQVSGRIMHVTEEGDYFHLHLEDQAVLAPGTAVRVYRSPHPGAPLAAVLEVTESEGGWANAQLTAAAPGARLSRGAPIEASR